MSVKLSTSIVELGKQSEELVKNNMVILFDKEAPEAIKHYCLLIDNHQFDGEIVAGDSLSVDDTQFRITKVGDAANENLKNLGHVTLSFGKKEIEDILPGSIHLEEPLLQTIKQGSKLTFFTFTPNRKESI